MRDLPCLRYGRNRYLGDHKILKIQGVAQVVMTFCATTLDLVRDFLPLAV